MKLPSTLAVALLLIAPLAFAPGSPALGPPDLQLPTDRYIVGFHDLAAADLEDGAWEGHEVLSTNPALGYVVVEASDPVTLEQDARQDENVRYYEWDDPRAFEATLVPDDPRYPDQYGFPQINAEAAWDLQLGDTSVLVGVIDTGIDNDHEDLVGTIADERDFVNDDDTADDRCGHGTHVAGTVAANTDNGIGVAGTAQVQLLIAKALTNTLLVTCTGSTSDIADAITWSTDNGADVISMSLGSSGGSSTLAQAVDYAWENGVLLVAAAGNDGPCSDCVSFPAAYDRVVAVTCTEEGEGQCSFSSDGPESELAAPGDAIWSTYTSNGYDDLSGTSMSTPHVSGVAALLFSESPGLTHSQVRSTMNDTAQDLGEAGWDEQFGWGEVDAQAALHAVSSGNKAPSASFTSDCTLLDCSFDASGSSDPDGAIASYDWELGDGSTEAGQLVEHTYAQAGTYTVTLTVTDDQGATDTTSEQVNVDDGTSPEGLDEDFETGDPGWTIEDEGGAASWQLTEARSASPTHSIAIAGYGQDESDHLVTEAVDLTGLSSPTLTVESWMEGERACFLFCTIYDHGRIQITLDGGDSWDTLEEDYWDSGGQWETLEYDLSAYEDETVQVRFSFFSDGSVQNEGWYLDDVLIE